MTKRMKIPRPVFNFRCDPEVMTEFEEMFCLEEGSRSNLIAEAIEEYLEFRKGMDSDTFTWLMIKAQEQKIGLMTFIGQILNKGFHEGTIGSAIQLSCFGQLDRLALSQINRSAQRAGKKLAPADREAILARVAMAIATDPQIWDKAVAEYNPSNYAVTAA